MMESLRPEVWAIFLIKGQKDVFWPGGVWSRCLSWQSRAPKFPGSQVDFGRDAYLGGAARPNFRVARWSLAAEAAFRGLPTKPGRDLC